MGLDKFFWIALFSISAMIVNSFGIWVVYKKCEWADKVKGYCMCFAAGMLITSPLIATFPEAIHKNGHAGYVALIGFLFMYLSNKIIKHTSKQKELAFGVTAIEGILIHSLLDGIIYSVTFSMSTLVGILSGIGLVVHEFAEGIITFSTLRHSGMSKKKCGITAFMVSSLSTPIGAAIAIPIVNYVNDSVLGLMLGFVAGVLIYISAAHLLPESSTHEKNHSITAFIVGIGLAFLISFIGHERRNNYENCSNLRKRTDLPALRSYRTV